MSTALGSSSGSFLPIGCPLKGCLTCKPPTQQLSRFHSQSSSSSSLVWFSFGNQTLSLLENKHCSRRGPECQRGYRRAWPSLCSRVGWRTQTWGQASARLSDCSTSSNLPSLLLLLLCLRLSLSLTRPTAEPSPSSPAVPKGSLHSFASFLLPRGTDTLRKKPESATTKRNTLFFWLIKKFTSRKLDLGKVSL